ncbi:sulfate/thiosulfate transport system substrate-binding protein [Pycnococcus provasolii]
MPPAAVHSKQVRGGRVKVGAGNFGAKRHVSRGKAACKTIAFLDGADRPAQPSASAGSFASWFGSVSSTPFNSAIFGGMGFIGAGIGAGMGNGLMGAAYAADGPGGKAKGGKAKSTDLMLASYAVTKAAYDPITSAFSKDVLETKNVNLRWKLTFAGSGTQTRAITDGLPADIFAPALALDMDQLVKEGLVNKDWPTRFPNGSIVAQSTIALVFRPGNPKAIKDWDDLKKPGVQIVTPNPKTGGGARWNFLALWGAAKLDKGMESNKDAQQYVQEVQDNVILLPRDSREAADAFFNQNMGDVLITYENEAILSNEKMGQQGKPQMPYCVPPVNIAVEGCIAVVDKNVDRKGPRSRALAEEFINHLFTRGPQEHFQKVGFRSVLPDVAATSTLPPVKRMWKVADLGGWDAMEALLFSEGKVVDQIQSEMLARQKAKAGK